MRIALVAPTHALRLGIRALIDEAAGYLKEVVSMEIVLESASLDQVEFSNELAEVLLLAGEAASPAALRRTASMAPGGMALLILVDDAGEAHVVPGLDWRAWGVLSADCSAAELGAAMLAVSEGLVVGQPELMAARNPFWSPEGLDEAFIPEHLTEREAEVLQLLARGLANKQIAAELGISEHTVKFHVSSIYHKLGAASRTEAVRIGVQQGLVLI